MIFKSAQSVYASPMSSPVTSENMEISCHVAQRLLLLASEKGWESNGTKNGVSLWEKKDEVPIFKGKLLIKTNAAKIADILLKPQTRFILDEHLQEAQLIERYNSHDTNNILSAYLMLTSYKGQFTVSAREFLTVCICQVFNQENYKKPQGKDSVFVLASSSVEDARFGPYTKGKVRGRVVIGGYVLKDTEKGCEVININQVSLGGSLPSVLVTPVLRSKPAEILVKLKDLCEKS